ncbi:MAG: prolyl-tRNA synthetase associated domain-containing protein [Bacteroidales bacterium]|nr:prolyl-tRNA synthetase associated domain-containing protein [Bacteroidales bacterium]
MKSNEINQPLSERQQKVVDALNNLGILFDIYFHPPIPTIEEAIRYWKQFDSTHCKNLFFRNHKGNRHYLVVFECMHQMEIHDLEHRLKQGKLSFASEQRMEKYLGLMPGSVSPFGLINDAEHHVHLFLDKNLQKAERLSFHPNDNTATIVIKNEDFIKFLESTGNSYEFIELY